MNEYEAKGLGPKVQYDDFQTQGLILRQVTTEAGFAGEVRNQGRLHNLLQGEGRRRFTSRIQKRVTITSIDMGLHLSSK